MCRLSQVFQGFASCFARADNYGLPDDVIFPDFAIKVKINIILGQGAHLTHSYLFFQYGLNCVTSIDKNLTDSLHLVGILTAEPPPQ